jgi:hypothetical protein
LLGNFLLQMLQLNQLFSTISGCFLRTCFMKVSFEANGVLQMSQRKAVSASLCFKVLCRSTCFSSGKYCLQMLQDIHNLETSSEWLIIEWGMIKFCLENFLGQKSHLKRERLVCNLLFCKSELCEWGKSIEQHWQVVQVSPFIWVVWTSLACLM